MIKENGTSFNCLFGLDVERKSNFYTIHSRLVDLIAVGGPFRLIIILVIEITHFSLCMLVLFL